MGALQLADASVARSLWTIAYTTALAALVLGGIGVRGPVNRGLPKAKSEKPAEGI